MHRDDAQSFMVFLMARQVEAGGSIQLRKLLPVPTVTNGLTDGSGKRWIHALHAARAPLPGYVSTPSCRAPDGGGVDDSWYHGPETRGGQGMGCVGQVERRGVPDKSWRRFSLAQHLGHGQAPAATRRPSTRVRSRTRARGHSGTAGARLASPYSLVAYKIRLAERQGGRSIVCAAAAAMAPRRTRAGQPQRRNCWACWVAPRGGCWGGCTGRMAPPPPSVWLRCGGDVGGPQGRVCRSGASTS